MSTELTFEDLKKKKKAPTKRMLLVSDQELIQRLNDAKVRRSTLENALLSDPENDYVLRKLDETSKEVIELEAKAREVGIEFVFRAIGRRKYERLLSENRPTEEQIKRHVAGGGKAEDVEYNVDTFPPKLVAASCIIPRMTENEAQQMWDSDEWSNSELVEIFGAAFGVNFYGRNVNLDEVGKG